MAIQAKKACNATGKPNVLVLLAAYNGEKFIAAQLNSILASEGVNVSIVVRDDGSTDKTCEIVKQYSHRSVTLITKNANDNRRGHLANFSGLCEYAVQHSQADYYAFADQDDVWSPQKLRTMLDEMGRLEPGYQGYETPRPLLVHCDLEVVDEGLRTIAPSFWRYQGLPDPALHTSRQFMFQNVVTGCATLFNRALLEAAAPIPDTAVVHDYWFALVAKSFGEVSFLDEPLIKYRQHGENAIGAKGRLSSFPYFEPSFWSGIKQYPVNFVKAQHQVACLAELSGVDSDYREFSQLHAQGLYMRVASGHKLVNSKNRTWGEKLFFSLVFTMLPVFHKRYSM